MTWESGLWYCGGDGRCSVFREIRFGGRDGLDLDNRPVGVGGVHGSTLEYGGHDAKRKLARGCSPVLGLGCEHSRHGRPDVSIP